MLKQFIVLKRFALVCRFSVWAASIKDAYKILDDIESVLAQNIESQALPRHGDGECEALYARAKGNCLTQCCLFFGGLVLKMGNQRIPPFPRVF